MTPVRRGPSETNDLIAITSAQKDQVMLRRKTLFQIAG
jgi:hypothetical protein